MRTKDSKTYIFLYFINIYFTMTQELLVRAEQDQAGLAQQKKLKAPSQWIGSF
jgi:hypothetical protein